MADESDEHKEFDPTERKLEEARRKGDIARSADLTAAAAQLGFLLAMLGSASAGMSAIGLSLANLIGDADRLSGIVFRDSESSFAGAMLLSLMGPLAVWFGVPAAAAVAVLIAQRGFALSGEKLMPRASRIDPISNAANKFGASGLVEFAKSAVKLCVISVILAVFLMARLPEVVGTAAGSERAGLVTLARLMVEFLAIAVAVALVVGVVDLLWQQFDHRRKLRMSRKELMDEHKQNEGDPYLKQARRQRGFDIATNRMLREVPKADVVVVNPTHYAVALKWERSSGRAPVCVAKGVDAVAARIRELAAEAGVPIHSDPPTARALHAAVDIGREIEPDHYRAVAAAIRFADDMRRRARTSRKPL